MKQFAVLGLGNFGGYLVTFLSEKGHQILAVDKDQEMVQQVRDKVHRAVVADATQQETLRLLGVQDMDAVVVAIGSNMSASILVILNLLELDVKRIIAKAINDPHHRILIKLGVTEITFPERDLALIVARKLHNPNMIDYLPIVSGYGIIELLAPQKFVGKTLRDLNIINRYGAQIIAVKSRPSEEIHMIPTANYVVQPGDDLILMGPSDIVDRVQEDD